GLQPRLPTTLLTGPVVSVAVPPFSTSPSTSKEPKPVVRSTRTLPPRVFQGRVPAEIPATGLSTLGAVMTPTTFCHRTTLSAANDEAAQAAAMKRDAANFI